MTTIILTCISDGNQLEGLNARNLRNLEVRGSTGETGILSASADLPEVDDRLRMTRGHGETVKGE
jgi:hypothetical protein